MNEILERLERIEATLQTLVKQRLVQDWYDTKAAAEFLGKSLYTVREYCRHGRVLAEKRCCGRGRSKEWMIAHQELVRTKAEGLRPDHREQRPRYEA